MLKFYSDAMLDIQLDAELYNAQGVGVYFTSFKDDSNKGDTNGDGNLTFPPSDEEWLGIYNNQDENYSIPGAISCILRMTFNKLLSS